MDLRNRMYARPGGRSRGFTLVELLVVVGIISVLAGIVLPVFIQVREAGRRATCVSNLRQIGLAFEMYVADFDGYYPNIGEPYLWMGRYWRWPLGEYLGRAASRDPAEPLNPLRSRGAGGNILVCPSDATAPQKWDSTSYAYSAAFYHTPAQINQMTLGDLWKYNRFPCVSQSELWVAFPEQKVLVAEWLTNHVSPAVDWWSWRGSRNYLFADGHIRFLPATRLYPAGDGFPDVNLTKNGLAGQDVD